MVMPETRYAKTVDGFHIAYQVFGDGPVDFVYLGPWYTHLEVNWQLAPWARFMTTIGSFTRVIMFDRRGNGLSDPVPPDSSPPFEARIDDIRAVMEAVGSQRAIIYGASESGALAMLFAALHPERTLGLIVIGGSARTAWAPDYPWGFSQADHELELQRIESMWGTEEFIRQGWPSIAEDPDLLRAEAALARNAMSPGAAVVYEKMTWDMDVRSALPSIHVPTLILHRAGDGPEEQQYLADHIPTARLVSLPGKEHVPYIGNQNEVTDQVREFVDRITVQDAVFDRVLATVLFTDIVDSTATAVQLGDARWREVLERHNATVRGLLGRFRGTEVNTSGDGFFATFDGPARAVRCAEAIVDAVPSLGINVRVGVHTGEVETIDGSSGGLGVVIGARVGALANAREVLVSQTVKDLTIGSGIDYDPAGEYDLKGVPERWRLYRVRSPRP